MLSLKVNTYGVQILERSDRLSVYVDIRLSSAYNTLLFMYIYKGRLEKISANIAFLFYK
jgi:hypothetical protein